MDVASVTLKGRAVGNFPDFEAQFKELGFTVIALEDQKITLEKTETADLKGKSHHFYQAVFFPDKLIFTYSVGQNRRKREFEALVTLLNLIKVAEDFYEVDAGEFHNPLATILNEARAIIDSESYATIQQVSELQEKYESLERKYKDLVLSSEQNARILLECEKKRDDYYSRIRQLEAMSDEMLVQEIFKWLKTHGGEMSIRQFAKSYSLPTGRVEEGLEYLLKNGYIRKKG